jgi:molybdopterin converting factor subunit 1
MKIGVLFFGVLKDLAGATAETVDLPEGARVRDLLAHFARGKPRLEAMLPSLAISVNREYAETDHALREGDEVALLPPVSGGAPEGGPNRLLKNSKSFKFDAPFEIKFETGSSQFARRSSE